MHKLDYLYFHKAINEASYSSFKQQLGSIVVNNGEIIGYGHNKCLSNGRIVGGSIHAEIDALLDIHGDNRRYRKGSTVYVCRINRRGDLQLAKPCHACEVKMKKMKVKTVYYSTSEGWKKWSL